MRAQTTNKSKLLKFLIISLLLHLIFIPLLYQGFSWGNIAKLEDNQQELYQIELLEEKDPEGQFVDSTDNQNFSERNVDSQFLSDKNRRVEKETQARNTTIFPQPLEQRSENQANLGNESNYQRENIERQDRDATRRIKREEAAQKENLNLNLPAKFLAQYARSPRNYLPEIAYGSETLLNTRQFKYASFFQKMKRKMEQVWHPLPIIRQIKSGRPTLTTRLRIILKSNGRLERVIILKSSGNKELDYEASGAVHRASPFINPPQQLVNENGLIVIKRWDFIISTRFTL